MKDNKKKNSRKNGFLLWMGREAGIEYKACLYFYVILFFYCCVLVINHQYSASILHMAEMILSTYVMGYIQTYLMRDFDEAEKIGAPELLFMLICSGIYTAEAWLLGWFGGGLVLGLFGLYILIAYLCAGCVNRLKRNYETRQLNSLLETYKQKGEDESE